MIPVFLRAGHRVEALLCEPALSPAATNEARLHPLFEKRPRPEALAIGLMHDLLCLKAQARCRCIHELERPHRMSKAKTARNIDVLGRRDALLNQSHSFDHQYMQQPVDREPRHVLHTNGCFADLRHDRESPCRNILAG